MDAICERAKRARVSVQLYDSNFFAWKRSDQNMSGPHLLRGRGKDSHMSIGMRCDYPFAAFRPDIIS